MLNFRLANEMYGTEPWMISYASFPAFTSILKDIRNRVVFSAESDFRCNVPVAVSLNSETKIASDPRGWGDYKEDLEVDDRFIGLIVLDGPITKSGGASSLGMKQVSRIMNEMNSDKRNIGFVILEDSPGGSTGGMKIMRKTVRKIEKQKPVYTLIEEEGTCCSAAYGIAAPSTKIYAQSEMSYVGSLGTMISFEGYEANKKDAFGMKHIRVYATPSVRKNEAFEKALNENNFTVLKDEVLDPFNEEFVSGVLQDRPQVANAEDYDKGKEYFAKDVVGTFIDGFATFQEVVEMVESDYDKNYANKKIVGNKGSKKSDINSINNNQMSLTLESLRNDHPEVYAEAVSVGVQQERDRVGSWMVHVETDSKAVKDGIKSGNAISATDREELLMKQTSKLTAKQMGDDSADPLDKKESESSLKGKEGNEDELKSAFPFKLTDQ